MLNYYRLERTPECHDMYFNNEGIFNFWDEYLFVHINNHNLVVVNRTGREFHGSITNSALAAAKTRVKNEFCGARGCADIGSAVCEIVKDWGEDICKIISDWINM